MNGLANDFVLEQDHTNETITVSHLGNGNFQISMYDLSGKLVFQESTLESLTISRGSNPRGVYLLEGVSSESNFTCKVIF
jgi:hypothetical protein